MTRKIIRYEAGIEPQGYMSAVRACRSFITNDTKDFHIAKLTISAGNPFLIFGFVAFEAGDSRLIRTTFGALTTYDDYVGVPLKHFEYKISRPKTEEEFMEFEFPYLEEYRKLFDFRTLNPGQILSLEVVGKIGGLMAYGKELRP